MITEPKDPRLTALQRIFPRARKIEHVDLSDVLEGSGAVNSYVLRFGKLECASSRRELVHFLHSCLAPWQLVGVVHPLDVLVEEYEASAVLSVYDITLLLVTLAEEYPSEPFLTLCLSAPLS